MLLSFQGSPGPASRARMAWRRAERQSRLVSGSLRREGRRRHSGIQVSSGE
jgi:hypothetical protein